MSGETTPPPTGAAGKLAELLPFIQQSEFCRPVLAELATRLPADDAELDALIGAAVAAQEEMAFAYLAVAAAGTNRPVQARHLARGIRMGMSDRLFAHLAWQMQGDLATPLLDGVQYHIVDPLMKAAALFVAALWCQEYRQSVWPAELIPQARLLARQKDQKPATYHWLAGIVALTNDDALAGILQGHGVPVAKGQLLAQNVLKILQSPIFTDVGESAVRPMGAGGTVRRSVARHGRNEPCSCGSGKKYKHCCYEQDQARLRQSTDVAGHTAAELKAEPERFLTAERLRATTPEALARFDPAKVPEDLLGAYVTHLAALNLLERGCEVLEQMGCPESRYDAWGVLLYMAIQDRRRDIAERLLKVVPAEVAKRVALDPDLHLLLAEGDAVKFLTALEVLAQMALTEEDADFHRKFAAGLMSSKLAGLGILVARSFIPLLDQKNAAQVFEQLLETRDELKLSADDPFSDLLDARFAETAPVESKDTVELRRTQAILETKAAEVKRLKLLLIGAQRDIARQEQRRQKPAPSATPAPTPTPDEEAALRALRRKVDDLKETLNDRHTERNVLRRELQKAYADLEKLRNASDTSVAEDAAENDREEDLLLPEETAAQQPVRWIEFPKDFPATLRRVPPSVARGTMSILGRIAAGEPAAFVGAVRLKACPDILRRRVGIDFRLLFRLLPDRVHVVDLIPRQDLERKIKTLV